MLQWTQHGPVKSVSYHITTWYHNPEDHNLQWKISKLAS